ncbi:condensation protein [Stappia taiwanensis]|uniref:Condensation protein n=2 Tax=Stappia taiwanensis TaxID=992267 RepID=A0A838XK83_9HYPH|nr:condensation protein [Stappia taiwanensis]GGE97170.1 hypothetical protein GCM10007285_25990 [Stappia taiwanensis]
MLVSPSRTGTPHKVVARFPCSQSQLRWWILDQLEPGNPAYNIAICWTLRGAFNAGSIEAAFAWVIERHEILRTRFTDANGRPMQEVVDKVPFKMSVIDLRRVTEEQRDKRMKSISAFMAKAPFDLNLPGLIRASLLLLDNDHAVLLTTVHHIVFDGWSIRVLGREIGEIASALDAGREPELPELPLQYGDYTLWQEEYLKSRKFHAETAFWRDKLGDGHYFEVPPDKPRPALRTNHGEVVSIRKPLDFGTRMEAAARDLQVSQFVLGIAVLSALLHRFTGEETILVGAQIAGRDDVDLENLIGVFINNLILRIEPPVQGAFSDHVAAVHETVAAAIDHQKMPFNKLVETLNPPRDASRNPLVSVNFNLQKAFLEDRTYGTFDLTGAPSLSPGAIYDLNFFMVGRPDGWRMSLEYNTDLFERQTVETLLDLWQQTYDRVLSEPAAPLASLPTASRQAATQAGTDAGLKRLLEAHPGVSEACVIEAEAGPPRAFVVPRGDYPEPIDQLPQTLQRDLRGQIAAIGRMPDISVLLNLPRLASGAVDRKGLTAVAAAPPPLAEPTEDAGTTPRAPASFTPDPAHIDALAEIWRDVLEVGTVTPEDDFFALGGHSLLALRMLARVRQRFDIKPDLAMLFQAPQLQSFAAAAFAPTSTPSVPSAPQETTRTNPWKLTTYRSGTGPAAIYTINHPFIYYRMTHDLPAEASVYNLNMFETEIDDELRARSFLDIASSAVDAMRITETTGPIALLGLCVNGTLAVEMARILRERGHEVSFVGVVDSWAPNYGSTVPLDVRARVRSGKRFRRVSYFATRLLTGEIPLIAFLKHFRLTLALMSKLGIKTGELTPEERANRDVTNLLVDAARDHGTAPPLDASVHLFRSQAVHPLAAKVHFGYMLEDGVKGTVHNLEGWHEYALTDSGIRRLATILRETLDADRP